jgi:NADPH:quinone reductase-like Zn-dependent oxidoreductase
MKAVIYTAYGPPEVLEVREVKKPQPRADEVLVRIHASTVNSSDWFIRSGIPQASAFTRVMKQMLGVRRPRRRILGLIVAGEVVEVDAAVKRFRVDIPTAKGDLSDLHTRGLAKLLDWMTTSNGCLALG